MGLENLEIDFNKLGAENGLNESEIRKDIIKVKAILSCPTCTYHKVFRNQFRQRDMEQMVVCIKIFDWLTCSKCGELINLNLEFEI